MKPFGILATLALVILLPYSAFAGWLPNQAQKAEALNLLAKNYLEPYDRTRCDEYAWKHLIAPITKEIPVHVKGCPEFDPYTTIFPPLNVAEMNKYFDGTYVGVGMVFVDNKTTVTDTKPGSPAQKAGIRVGDVVRSIRKGNNGEYLTVSSVQDIIAVIGNEPGVTFTIRVSRGTEEMEFSVATTVISLPTVTGKVFTKDLDGHALAKPIAYIRISPLFSEQTADELESLLTGFKTLNGTDIPLVLDVRNNSGGITNAAIEVAYLFTDDITPTMLVRTRAKTYHLTTKMPIPDCFNPPIGTDGHLHPVTRVWIGGVKLCTPFVEEGTRYIKKPGRFSGTHIAVLANDKSASASEWLIAMMKGPLRLKNKARITVIGNRSFGKAVGQRLTPLPPDANGADHPSIRVTTMEFRSATEPGKRIHGVGIDPDDTVNGEPDGNGHDPALARGLAVLSGS